MTEDNSNELVTLEMVCFTEDLKHDSFAVKTFEDAAENYLRSIGIPVNVIFQWSDNCSNQYKSKYAFDILSTSATPKMKNYYGEKHGKSAADGIIGRLKMKIDQEIRSGTVTLDTTDDLYNYCINKLKTQPTVGCQHYRRYYILIEEIPRPKRTAEPNRVMDTLKIHSVRSIGTPGVVEKQELSCMCDVCMEGGERCQNLHLVLGWSRVDLFSKSGEDFVNTHWPKVHNTRKERVKMSKRRRKKLTTAVNVNTSLQNKRKPPGKPNQDVTDKRSKRRRNKLTTAVNVNTSLRNKRKPPGKLIRMSLTKGPRGEEINLLLLLMSIHHSGTKGSLQENLIRMSLKRLKEETLAIKKETERKLHGLMLLMIWRSQIPIRIWREECKRLHWNHQFKWIKHHFPLDKIQFMI